MRPVMGARFTWQSKTLMKTEMRCIGRSPRPSSGGGTKKPIDETMPSAGETTRPSRIGVTRLRVAEEVDAPDRRDEAEPAERAPEPVQHQRRHEEAGDEDVAFRMDRDGCRLRLAITDMGEDPRNRSTP